jgi:hypothetical protein
LGFQPVGAGGLTGVGLSIASDEGVIDVRFFFFFSGGMTGGGFLTSDAELYWYALYAAVASKAFAKKPSFSIARAI